jgi:hypothetical protein
LLAIVGKRRRNGFPQASYRSATQPLVGPARRSRAPRAIFGRSYAAEPDVLIEQRRQDEAIAEAGTLLLTIPNQLGVAYCAHAIEAILAHVAPALGWR